MKISLVFPAYNEAESITTVVADFVKYCTNHRIDHEILIVNDGSTDRTAPKIQELVTQYPGVEVVTHPTNRGYGAALRSGFAAASGDCIFFTDSDGQFTAADLNHTIPLIEPNTIILGYRQPRVERGIRLMNAWLWNGLVRLTLGVKVRDLNCAWKVFPRSLLADCAFTSNGAFISAELLYFARKQKMRFQEIPVHHRSRVSGRSTGANPKVIWRALQELAIFTLQRSRATKQSVVLPVSKS